MKSLVVNRIRGYVKIEVAGQHSETLLNRVIGDGLQIWDIGRNGSGHIECFIALRDFFRLRPYLRQSNCRVRVRQRHGFPFFLDKLERRKFFAVGLFAFVAGLYLLSSLVWRVQVEGVERIPESVVLEAAKRQGIYPLQWKFRLEEPDELSRQLLTLLPGTSWIGVEVHGTTVTIKVVEATMPEPRALINPRHLVASHAAEVTQIFAEKGKAQVKPHTVVRKGDVLISGIIGEGASRQTVAAQGTVKGAVWEKAAIEMPLKQQMKVYTGDKKKKFYLVIGNRALQVWGFGKPDFGQFETLYGRKSLQWREYRLPVGWMTETLMSVGVEERVYSPEEASQLAIEQARADVLSNAGNEAKLLGEKVLASQNDNGKWTMEVLFEVERDIAEELPIVEQPPPSEPFISSEQ